MIKIWDVMEAKLSFWEIIKSTPLEKSYRLSKQYDANIYLKREDTQIVRSYKIRWAFNAIRSLSETEKKKWIVCASAGNHAQWVAFTCSTLKIKWTIFMPKTTPEQKVYKTKKFWWDFIEVVLVWDSFDDAYNEARVFEKKSGAIFIHPFDDEKIIAWQGTIGLEILEQMNEKPDLIVCPIGWGWLVSWIISVMNELSPSTGIIWVEPSWAASMKHSLLTWKNNALHKIDTFVDWAAVKKVWDQTFEICKNYWLKVYDVPENRICTTMLEYLREDWFVLEPAWALATDALKDLKDELKWKTVVVIVSGWNFDFERLPEVKERSLKFEWLKKYIVVNFPQRPGALREFLNVLGPNDDITRFEYLKKSNKDKAPAVIWIESNDRNNFLEIFEKLKKIWINFEDITEHDMYYDLLI